MSQPFYHRAVVLFTSTETVDRDAFTKLLQKIASSKVTDVQCEEIDAEPGDPADLG